MGDRERKLQKGPFRASDHTSLPSTEHLNDDFCSAVKLARQISAIAVNIRRLVDVDINKPVCVTSDKLMRPDVIDNMSRVNTLLFCSSQQARTPLTHDDANYPWVAG